MFPPRVRNPQRYSGDHAHASRARDHDAEFRRAGAEGPGPDVELGACGQDGVGFFRLGLGRWKSLREGIGGRGRGRGMGEGIVVWDQGERLPEGVDVVEE